jgi:hypothetical protein
MALYPLDGDSFQSEQTTDGDQQFCQMKKEFFNIVLYFPFPFFLILWPKHKLFITAANRH